MRANVLKMLRFQGFRPGACLTVAAALALGPAWAGEIPQGDPWGPSAALLAQGKYAEAAAQAHQGAQGCAGPVCGKFALIEGRARFALHDLAGAAAAAHLARGNAGPLEAHAALLEGEALLVGGRTKESMPPLRDAVRLDGEGPVGTKAAGLLADALMEDGDPAAAWSQAEVLLRRSGATSPLRPQLLWLQARARVRLAEQMVPGPARQAGAQEALQAVLRFWREAPDHPAQAEVQPLFVRLSALLGADIPPPTGRDHQQRAQRCLLAGLPHEAVSEARAAHASLTGEEKLEAALLYARALAADGRRAEAGPMLTEAFSSKQVPILAAAGLLLARGQARVGHDAEAIRTLDALARRAPQTSEADEGAFLAARLLVDAGKLPEARKRLLALASKHGPSAADARWTLAWMSFAGKKPDAAERFAAYTAGADDDEGRARGEYWQGRAGRPSEARGHFQRALQLDPLGYTGVLARAALDPSVPPEVAFPPAAAKAIELPAALSLATELLSIGWHAESANETDRYAQAHRGRPQELLPALALWQRAGRFDRSVNLAQQLLIGRPPPLEFRSPERAPKGAEDPTGRLLLEFAHPAAFADAVGHSAKRLGIDPYLLLSVARRESVFKADARSAAGAVGLVQLLPVTARRAAQVLGRPELEDSDLTDPAVALDLGAWYLAELLGRFGDATAALAAYNAGPKVAGAWVSKGRGRATDEWVEEIPYKETRHYVKAVIGAWSTYRILAGGRPPKLAATVGESREGAEF
ncbi:MAG: lytic transglycosylase domain-containing protein [Deltaproteobacteria bacterium]|nr:lytic transglycosylase domain-containing protein [Deltaproteobacteria bacterium]